MDGREFARLLKHESIDAPLQSVLRTLTSPKATKPAPATDDPIRKSVSNFYNAGALREQRNSAWFLSLSTEHQAIFEEILRGAIELGAFAFCTLIDGVGSEWEGVFEIRAVDAKGRETLINPQNSEMLHDLLSEICAEDREN